VKLTTRKLWATHLPVFLLGYSVQQAYLLVNRYVGFESPTSLGVPVPNDGSLQ